MKIINLIVVLAFATTAMAQNFEGVINMTTANTELKEEATLTWYLKGEKSRMDINSSADGHSSTYTFISDERGLSLVAEGHVTEIPASALKVQSANQTMLSKEEGVVMNGFKCAKAVFFDGKNQTTYWLTNDLGIGFDDIPSVIRKNMPAVNVSGFPVKMEKRSAEGEILITQEVTSVKTTSVSDSKFERN